MIDQIDRKTIPRLPWHDVTVWPPLPSWSLFLIPILQVSLQGLAAADVALNFIQRWNHSIESTSEYRNYPYLFPKPVRVANKSQPTWYARALKREDKKFLVNIV